MSQGRSRRFLTQEGGNKPRFSEASVFNVLK